MIVKLNCEGSCLASSIITTCRSAKIYYIDEIFSKIIANISVSTGTAVSVIGDVDGVGVGGGGGGG